MPIAFETDYLLPPTVGHHVLVLLHQAGTLCQSAALASVGQGAEGSTHRCINEWRIAKAPAPVAEV